MCETFTLDHGDQHLMTEAHYYVRLEVGDTTLKISPTPSYEEALREAFNLICAGGDAKVLYHSTLDIDDFEVYPLWTH
jgi:cellobiose-specific phosphotransferase system component IIA